MAGKVVGGYHLSQLLRLSVIVLHWVGLLWEEWWLFLALLLCKLSLLASWVSSQRTISVSLAILQQL